VDVLYTTAQQQLAMQQLVVNIVISLEYVLTVLLPVQQVYVFNTTAQQQLAMQQSVVNTVTSLEYVLTPLLLVQ